MSRRQVPCKYDTEKRMYVPTGGRDVVPGGKVGTRDKTAEDLQALDVGESGYLFFYFVCVFVNACLLFLVMSCCEGCCAFLQTRLTCIYSSQTRAS